MTEDRHELPALERDVLLASSGEISWPRRLLLSWRLRSSDDARSLAETLKQLELCASPRVRRRLIPLNAIAVAAMAAGLVALWPRGDRAPRTAAVPEPIHRTTALLLIASTRLGALPSSAMAMEPDRDPASWPRLPEFRSSLSFELELR